MSHRILVIDDESGIREALRQVLEYEGYSVRVSPSGQDGLLAYQSFHPHLVLLDVKMAGMDGLETLTKLREQDPATLAVMISGHGTIATAVEATHRGAFDFLEKPLDTDRLLITLRNALAQRQLTADNARLRAVADTRYGMAGRSQALREVLEMVERVGPTAARVLVTGENGTGKELVARALHQRSPRHAEAFVEVNCAAIPSELIESELFGHMKGSFTGAVGDRSGKFEQADGGTLFLDEIGDMTLAAQAKVLRALQEGIITRVGGSKAIQVDVRVIAATNKALEQEIAAGRFREDLFYRLNVVPIHVPPLQGAARGHSGPGGLFRRTPGGNRRRPEPSVRGGGAGAAPGLAVARQCPRAAQHRRAGVDPGHGKVDHRRGHRPPRGEWRRLRLRGRGDWFGARRR